MPWSSKLAERARFEMWLFMVKGQSSVTPRFSTEPNMGRGALTTVIESGKEDERDLDFHQRIQSLHSVLSWSSLSLFSVIHILTSSIHFCVERRSGTSLGAADFWSWESPEYNLYWNRLVYTIFSNLDIILKSQGRQKDEIIRYTSQWGTAESEVKVSTLENPELTNVHHLKPGADQNIAIHASPTTRNFLFT